MKTSLSFLISAMVLIISSCSDSTNYAVPTMGDYTIYEVEIGELSGICFNKERTGFLACGDKGIIKSISFDGKATDLWKNPSDMEGISLDPSNGDIYLAIEGKQEVHRISAPEYNEQKVLFAIQEAVDGQYKNSGLEAIEYYKKDMVFVGSQKQANLWKCKVNGKVISKVSLSEFAAEIAGLCYDPEAEWLWISDSKNAQIYICNTEGKLLATYDIPFIDNAESICVDRAAGYVWVGSDEDATKLYRIKFEF
ncbi:MAG: SdiA-regulated domain-containing protein [Bacteroidales bacterium]|nr:SdiA-regulated domain-containing protein [Bacteroidales bacterium]